MKTEQDTFDALKRTPFEKVYSDIARLSGGQAPEDVVYEYDFADEILHIGNWTHEDFIDEARRRQLSYEKEQEYLYEKLAGNLKLGYYDNRNEFIRHKQCRVINQQIIRNVFNKPNNQFIETYYVIEEPFIEWKIRKHKEEWK
jgi:hypothetical protein